MSSTNTSHLWTSTHTLPVKALHCKVIKIYQSFAQQKQEKPSAIHHKTTEESFPSILHSGPFSIIQLHTWTKAMNHIKAGKKKKKTSFSVRPTMTNTHRQSDRLSCRPAQCLTRGTTFPKKMASQPRGSFPPQLSPSIAWPPQPCKNTHHAIFRPKWATCLRADHAGVIKRVQWGRACRYVMCHKLHLTARCGGRDEGT